METVEWPVTIRYLKAKWKDNICRIEMSQIKNDPLDLDTVALLKLIEDGSLELENVRKVHEVPTR